MTTFLLALVALGVALWAVRRTFAQELVLRDLARRFDVLDKDLRG